MCVCVFAFCAHAVRSEWRELNERVVREVYGVLVCVGECLCLRVVHSRIGPRGVSKKREVSVTCWVC